MKCQKYIDASENKSFEIADHFYRAIYTNNGGIIRKWKID